MDGAVIRGVVGSITWSYYKAAAIEGYTVTRTGTKESPRWSLRARVILADPYKLSQRPLVFAAPHQHGVWRWPIVEMDLVEDRLTAVLAPPVEAHDPIRTGRNAHPLLG
jgi:hypothetical protein